MPGNIVPHRSPNRMGQLYQSCRNLGGVKRAFERRAGHRSGSRVRRAGRGSRRSRTSWQTRAAPEGTSIVQSGRARYVRLGRPAMKVRAPRCPRKSDHLSGEHPVSNWDTDRVNSEFCHVLPVRFGVKGSLLVSVFGLGPLSGSRNGSRASGKQLDRCCSLPPDSTTTGHEG